MRNLYEKLKQWVANLAGVYTSQDMAVREFQLIEQERQAWEQGYQVGLRHGKGRNVKRKGRKKASRSEFNPLAHEQTK